MRQIKTFSDTRLDNMCSYCGDFPDTKDHVPSRILLNEPFPENLPVVPCCNQCNQSFSRDEVYFACLIECILCKSTDLADLRREKVINVLRENEGLRLKIANSTSKQNGEMLFNVEAARLENVILKLAKGHLKFENSQPQFDEPDHLAYKTLHTMTNEEISNFLSVYKIQKAPEVGSRGMQNLLFISNDHISSTWIIVQPNIYSYYVYSDQNFIVVKIIIQEYLAAEVSWLQNC